MMPQRYLAILSKTAAAPSRANQEAIAKMGLTQVLSGPRLSLWVEDISRMSASPSGRTVVVGDLFTREEQSGPAAGIAPEIEGARDVPAQLSSRYWGTYVAFCQSTLGSLRVFREPGGGLPCYVHETSSAITLFSDIGLVASLGLVRPKLDWAQVASNLAWIGLRQTLTAFEGVYEIPQGSSLAIAGGYYCELVPCWSPWDFVGRSELNRDALHDKLRSTISATVRTLAQRYERIQLSLSGGLDSSVVASALSGTDTVALTLIAPGSDGDERGEAGAVAAKFGLELRDAPYRFGDVDPRTSSAVHLCRPVGSLGRMSFDNAHLRFSREKGTQALFTGFGGDNVFCLMRSGTPIADRFRTKGERFASRMTLADVCTLNSCSMWQALGSAAPKVPRSAARYHWRPQPAFLSSEILGDLEGHPEHGWLDAPADALPGKAAHIAMIMRPQNFAEGFARTAAIEMVNPLLAQPIIELCLSIPTWEWVEGGRDRAPVRAAFADILPRSTLSRTTKGSPSAFYRQLVDHYRAEIRGRLLDGLLVRERVLDRQALEAALSEPVDLISHTRILDLCDAENWVRAYQG